MTTVRLLPEDEMRARLLKIDNNNPHTIDGFHSQLLKGAGQEKEPLGLALFFVTAFTSYTQELPPIIAIMMRMRTAEYLSAMTDDVRVIAEARGYLGDTGFLAP